MKKFKNVLAVSLALGLVIGIQLPVSSQAAEATVTVVMPTQWKEALNPSILAFNEANKDVDIAVNWGGAQDQLIAANKAPDIINTGDLLVNVQKNLLTNLNTFIMKDKTIKAMDFYPQLYSRMKVDGEVLAFPYRFNVQLLYYNKGLFDDAKVKYPTAKWTQKEYIAAAKATTKTSGGKATQWGATTVTGWWGEWLIHVRQAGGEWYKNGAVVLDSDEAVNGLTFFRDKITKNAVAPGPKDDSLGGFSGGKTAMHYGGHTGDFPSYRQTSGLNWDIEVLPKGSKTNKGGELSAEAWGISAKSDNKAAAYKALAFLVSKDFLTTSWEKLGLPPTRMSVAAMAMAVPKSKRLAPKNIEALFAGIKTGMTLPNNIPFIKVTQEVVQPLIDKMLEGTLTPAQVGEQATENANKALDSL